MLKTFAISFRLRNTFKTNGIIWSLKSIPIIRRFLPSALYKSSGLKLFANVISGILEFFSIFLGKALYLLTIWFLTLKMKSASADSFAHILVFLTIIGGLANTHIFSPSKDKYYALILMRMDTKKYTLTSYFYFLLKMLVGFTLFSLPFGLLCGASLLTCFSVPLYVLEVKLLFTSMSLSACKKEQKTRNENKLSKLVWLLSLALLLAALTPYLSLSLPELVLPVLAGVLLIPGIVAFRYICRFDAYRPIYKELLLPENFIPDAHTAGAAAQLSMQEKITVDKTVTSNKSGYGYFNDLFVKRHTKLLTRSARRLMYICAVVFVGVMIACCISADLKDKMNEILLTSLPYFLFIMYLLNRGPSITQAMFMNCDHSMLAYRFYRQPKAVLSLFVARLKSIIVINLVPAVVIATALPLLLYLTGGTDAILNYVVLFVTILAMSIFFSVHNIVLYYLLQPYNVNLESKSAAYGIVNTLTYLVCYGGIKIKLPTLAFGSLLSIFCVLYAVVAVLLAYRLAPRTFKLRN